MIAPGHHGSASPVAACTKLPLLSGVSSSNRCSTPAAASCTNMRNIFDAGYSKTMAIEWAAESAAWLCYPVATSICGAGMQQQLQSWPQLPYALELQSAQGAKAASRHTVRTQAISSQNTPLQ